MAQTEAPHCLSVLMPTHVRGRETAQDPLRFKNSLQDAEQQLVGRGMRAADARELLKPLRDLIDDRLFWLNQGLGLAVFVSETGFWQYRIPFSLPDVVIVDKRFYLAPLMPIVSEDLRFYVLAISPKQVRLVEATRHHATEVEVPGGVENLEQYLENFELEKQLQFHTGAPPTSGSRLRAAIFHGQPGGAEESSRKQRLLEYCRLIDAKMRSVFRRRPAPVVLACDRRLAPIYRQANTSANLAEVAVLGNPDLEKPADLHARAWAVVEPGIAAAKARAIALFRQVFPERGSHHLPTVLVAAEEGRVDVLLTAAGTQRWGKFDGRLRQTDLHEAPQPGDEELLNRATVSALSARRYRLRNAAGANARRKAAGGNLPLLTRRAVRMTASGDRPPTQAEADLCLIVRTQRPVQHARDRATLAPLSRSREPGGRG